MKNKSTRPYKTVFIDLATLQLLKENKNNRNKTHAYNFYSEPQKYITTL